MEDIFLFGNSSSMDYGAFSNMHVSLNYNSRLWLKLGIHVFFSVGFWLYGRYYLCRNFKGLSCFFEYACVSLIEFLVPNVCN